MATAQLGTAIQRGLHAARPASGDATRAGGVWYSTDTGILYMDDGSAWIEVGRSTAGLGSMATQDAAAVAIAGGSVAGITDLAVADGGTGASTASAARTNLGLAVGTDVEAHDADLTAIAGLSPTNDDLLQRKAGAWTNRTAAQVAADLPAVVGDSGSGGTKGLVPPPGAGDAAAGKFLKADGTFAVPAGSGLTNPMTTQDDLIVGGASGAVTRLAKGTDGQVLTVDPTTHHLVWATPSGGGVTPGAQGQALITSGGTTAWATIGNPADRPGWGGAGFASEYESGSSGLTWSAAPATEDVGGTIPSCLYLAFTATDGDKLGYRAWAPSGDFDLRAKIEVAATGVLGLIVMDATNAARAMIQYNVSGTVLQAFTYAGSYSHFGTDLAYTGKIVYLRIARAGTTYSFYYSTTGNFWLLYGTATPAITVARCGFRLDVVSGNQFAIDWLRANV